MSADNFVPFVFFVLLIKNKEESTLMSPKGRWQNLKIGDKTEGFADRTAPTRAKTQ